MSSTFNKLFKFCNIARKPLLNQNYFYQFSVEAKRPNLRAKKAFLTIVTQYFINYLLRIDETNLKNELITDRAAERIKELMQRRTNEEVKGVKIGVRRRGCSGLTYTMNYCTAISENKFDEIISDKGVTIVIDNKALMALVGTEMDYVEDDLKSEFVFNNPNSKVKTQYSQQIKQQGTCGCGESFHI